MGPTLDPSDFHKVHDIEHRVRHLRVDAVETGQVRQPASTKETVDDVAYVDSLDKDADVELSDDSDDSDDDDNKTDDIAPAEERRRATPLFDEIMAELQPVSLFDAITNDLRLWLQSFDTRTLHVR
jgi:hypothetical protein